MGENYNCRTLVISDDPSDKDEFGDSHNRIAQTIANLMHTETGGKSIGLEGEWGTGKSTIIKLLSNALN
ncbi:MAG: P-loop NTPase fold protein, partial [Chloroflexota bacterium]